MSLSLAPLPSRRWSVSILALVFPLGLACSGLPVPGAILGEGDPVADEPEEGTEPEEAGDDEPAVPDPAPTPATPESLFAELDPTQAPPYERGIVKCPAPTMAIRHPKAGVLSVYCATGSGVRSGPYTEWQRNTLRVAATNVDGKLEGTWTRWDGGKKVEEQVYAAGLATGDYASWDTEGHLLVRGRMVDGKRDGRFIDRTVENGEVVPGGACYEAGTELWRTADDGELVSKACGADAVAEG